MEIEKWKGVVGLEHLYEVSSIGRVKSLKRVVQRKCPNKKGMCKFSYPEKIRCLTFNKRLKEWYLPISKGGGEKWKQKKVHRLVAEAFIPNLENKPQVNHKDGNRSNNTIENLEWVTASENVYHAVHTGLIKRGNMNEDKVREIRIFSSRGFNKNEIAKKLDISTMTVWRVLTGRRWTHIT